MTRMSRHHAVFFFEEYIPCNHHLPYLEIHNFADGIVALRPRLPSAWNEDAREESLRDLLQAFLKMRNAAPPVLWFYTPMMLPLARDLPAAAVVYNCMDELSAFRFASPKLPLLEAELMQRADVMFTGGHAIYDNKRRQHDNIHALPSAVDVSHFHSARHPGAEPDDQRGIGYPRLGFCGVVDERMDRQLLHAIAEMRPEWQFIILGPVAKIDARDLPRAPNLHYLGAKSYADLPLYFSGWNAGLMPFAMNEATRFLSPTKTPEYLAAGLPVVSTPIPDVVRQYSGIAAVTIAEGAQQFVDGCERALGLSGTDPDWQASVDTFLATLSWDRTAKRMLVLLEEAIERNQAAKQASAPRRAASRHIAAIRPKIRPAVFDYLVVGAGFAGSVLAERLAAGSGKTVLLIDRRPHLGGNAHDHFDAAGVLVHKYGPHIFHTNSQEIVDYLSRFTQWRAYQHRVLARVDDLLLPIPINRTTLNSLYGSNLQDDAATAAFLRDRAEPIAEVMNSRDAVVSQVGTELYRTFFEGYTRKQWGLDPSQLDKSVTSRVPTRLNTDDRYFLDAHQMMPAAGYTRMFENMVDHRNIHVELGVAYEDVVNDVAGERIIYTGPIDSFFEHCFGRLPYRSLRFDHQTLFQRRFQPVAVVNYPSLEIPYTRVTEYKHLTGQVHPHTSITYEYASDIGEPYYPVPRPENQALYRQYAALADRLPDVTFVGRLGTYRYYNMD